MELEPEIKVPGLKCNRSLPEGVLFVNNMVIEEPEYGIFFTNVFGDQAFQRLNDIHKVRVDSLVSYLVVALMIKTPENDMFGLKLKKLIAEHPDQEKLKSLSEQSLSELPSGRSASVYKKDSSIICYIITEDLAHQHVSFLLEVGRSDDARSLAEKLCNEELSEAVNLWVLHLLVEMRRITTPSNDDFSFVFDLLFIALPLPRLAFYRNCIEIEMNIASSAAGKVHLAKVHKLYEAAVTPPNGA
ncbi:hypothetical protein Tco_1182022 [Tanacetum coccineum]